MRANPEVSGVFSAAVVWIQAAQAATSSAPGRGHFGLFELLMEVSILAIRVTDASLRQAAGSLQDKQPANVVPRIETVCFMAKGHAA
jgi:hypothetical protein